MDEASSTGGAGFDGEVWQNKEHIAFEFAQILEHLNRMFLPATERCWCVQRVLRPWLLFAPVFVRPTFLPPMLVRPMSLRNLVAVVIWPLSIVRLFPLLSEWPSHLRRAQKSLSNIVDSTQMAARLAASVSSYYCLLAILRIVLFRLTFVEPPVGPPAVWPILLVLFCVSIPFVCARFLVDGIPTVKVINAIKTGKTID